MHKQPWMIFQPEGTSVYYQWCGTHPILVYVAPNEGEPEKHVWGGNKDSFTELPSAEKSLLDLVACTARKTVFTLNKRRFIVHKRGEFICPT